MDRPLRIATLGDLVLDVIVIGDPNAEKTARDAEGAVRITPGGGAANFAVAAARAGAEVAFFGRVGDDPAGRLLVAELARDGVTARVKTTSAGKTGHVLVLVASGADGQNRMISDPGASAALAPEDLDEAVLRGADLVHLTGYSWLREGPSAAARAALDAAKAGGAKVTMDPGPTHLIRAYGPPRFLADLDAARFDVLFPNREEAEAMTSEREPHAAAVALRRVSPVVVLKLGGDGCLVAWGDRLDHLPAAVARVIDTTGAGDAFAAAFAVEYATNGDPMAAARAATFAAAAQVERIGAR